jgi:uncharacterized protein YjbI with pentapeptide repeats
MALIAEKTGPPALNELETRVARRELAQVLEQHQLWLDSNGTEGERADLTGARLDRCYLAGAKLRRAILDSANLKNSDLMLADLREASLIGASLQGANLLGTQFRDADLQSSRFTDAIGMVESQFAGANLHGAEIPLPVAQFSGIQTARQLSTTALWFFAAVMALCGLAAIRIANTVDVQLVRNDPTIPVRGLRSALPLVQFYSLGPIALLVLFIGFHLYAQRLWQCVAELPAVFPDGLRLDRCLPRMVCGVARRHVNRLWHNRPPLSVLEKALALILLYWVVPTTLALFWVRYLTAQDVRGSLLNALVTVAATFGAVYFLDAKARAFRFDPIGKEILKYKFVPKKHGYWIGGVATLTVVLMLLTFGGILGAPAGFQSPADARQRTWAADLFRIAGLNPFPNLNEQSISTRPSGWYDGREDFGAVRGSQLNGVRLRHAQMYGVFLVKAHMLQADLRNSFLSEADLRQANLRQAILKSATLDRARLNRANLQKADLRGANLAGADLGDADLAYALLSGANLTDAKLQGVSFYGTDLRGAILMRSTVSKADFREANLADADFSYADLRGADLWSGKLAGAKLREAQAGQAVLVDADLRAADLRGADLQGAILRGTDLTGAMLQGADLRGAAGLDASQVCSAANHRDLKLDDALAAQVVARCGQQ